MNNFNNNINNSLNSAEDRFSLFSNKISRLLKVAFTGAVAKTAFDQLFKNPLKVSADFEAQMSNVKALISSSSKNLEKDMEDLSKKAEETGATTKFTATEAAQAYEYMASKGWETQQMIDGLSGVVNLSAAANMDLARACSH